MRTLTYLAAFESSDKDNGYSVFFPDLPGCVSVGDNFEHARTMAAEALGLHIYGMEKDGDEIPPPSDAKNLDKEETEGCIVCPVTIYPNLFKNEMNNRAVKTNTTIPAWLKELAEAKGINYSHLLQSALMEVLEVGSTPNDRAPHD